MKTLYPNTIKLLGCLLVAVLFQSCITKPGTWQNDQISSGKRDDFHKLNEQLINALRAKNDDALTNLESQDMLQDHRSLRDLEILGNSVRATNFAILDEYYIVNRYKDTDTVRNSSAGINSYKLSYNGVAHEMYIALFVPKDKVLANQDLLTIIYAKFNYGWKISSATISPYRINGKTAPELYLIGKDKYEKKHFADARLTLELAMQCNVINENWHYDHLGNVNELYEKASAETMNKYRFPVVIDDVPGEPRIFRMSNQKSNDGWFPAIYYVTKINIADTTAIKNQNIQIRKVIGKLFPGINKDKKYIYYSACSRLP
ncbi:MAG: hypothetical protein JWQ57_502, partial [Mucilaginibacter sp.]|nr:hypothetical protein [Mucilaginibacter sp.]